MSKAWAPELRIDAARAAELIAEQFPSLRPVDVRPLPPGWDNTVFAVNGRYVFRFPRRAIAVSLIETEAKMLPLIAHKLPLPVPLPEFLGEPRGAFPWPFSGYAVLPGTTADVFHPTQAQLVALATPLATFLRALHRISPAPLVLRGLLGDEIGRLDHGRRMPVTMPRLQQFAAEGYLDDARPFITFLDRAAPVPADRSVVVHGSLYLRHLLLDDEGTLCGVIDWGDLHLGDPAIDLAIVATLPPAAQDVFFDVYGVVDEPMWTKAKYCAIVQAAAVAAFGFSIRDATLAEGGISSLRAVAASL